VSLAAKKMASSRNDGQLAQECPGIDAPKIGREF